MANEHYDYTSLGRNGKLKPMDVTEESEEQEMEQKKLNAKTQHKRTVIRTFVLFVKSNGSQIKFISSKWLNRIYYLGAQSYGTNQSRLFVFISFHIRIIHWQEIIALIHQAYEVCSHFRIFLFDTEIFHRWIKYVLSLYQFYFIIHWVLHSSNSFSFTSLL